MLFLHFLRPNGFSQYACSAHCLRGLISIVSADSQESFSFVNSSIIMWSSSSFHGQKTCFMQLLIHRVLLNSKKMRNDCFERQLNSTFGFLYNRVTTRTCTDCTHTIVRFFFHFQITVRWYSLLIQGEIKYINSFKCLFLNPH